MPTFATAATPAAAALVRPTKAVPIPFKAVRPIEPAVFAAFPIAENPFARGVVFIESRALPTELFNFPTLLSTCLMSLSTSESSTTTLYRTSPTSAN